MHSLKYGTPGQIRTDTEQILNLPIGLQGHILIVRLGLIQPEVS